jgi:hypothetical protein
MKLFRHARPEAFRICARLGPKSFELFERFDMRVRGEFRRRRKDTLFLEY